MEFNAIKSAKNRIASIEKCRFCFSLKLDERKSNGWHHCRIMRRMRLKFFLQLHEKITKSISVRLLGSFYSLLHLSVCVCVCGVRVFFTLVWMVSRYQTISGFVFIDSLFCYVLRSIDSWLWRFDDDFVNSFAWRLVFIQNSHIKSLLKMFRAESLSRP